MNNYTAIIPGSLDLQRPEVVAEALRSLVNDNLTVEAEEIFSRYNRAQPGNYYLAMVYADILIDAGELEDAERLVEGELQKNPERFPLLLRLGNIDEKRGQNLNAFDLYQQCELLADVAEDKREALLALERVKKKIHSAIHFKPEAYLVELQGNKNPLNLQYNMVQLKERRELLEAILAAIDPRAKTALEVECDGGTIARNLSGHGFEADGTAAEMTDILLAIGFEYIEKLRKARKSAPNYYHYEFDEEKALILDKKDVIMVLPTMQKWYIDQGIAKASAVIRQLATRAKRQLFFYIPAGGGQSAGGQDLAQTVLYCLRESKRLPSEPILIHESENGGRLYLIKQRQAEAGNLAKVLPKGLGVIGSRSSIFEVEMDKCCSLNGFSFTTGGWNHFTALLEELLANPDLDYKDSILKKFYDRFHPRNRQEQFFGCSGKSEEYIQPLDRGWTLLPWAQTKNRTVNPYASPQMQTGGNPHYGPNSTQFGIRQCQRLLATYTLIKQHGYLPEIFPDGYVQGYFLIDGSDYRFYVNEGQHRMAALGLLGYDVIKARYNPDFLPLVDLKYIKQWPQVRRGLYSEEVAEKVFRYYFAENGRRKAGQLGLLS